MRTILFVTLLLVALSCKKETEDVTYQVNYQISCPDCYVYCKGPGGAAQNFYHQNSSWTYSYEASVGDTLVLIAQNTSSGPAAVTGIIKVNGAVVAGDTSYCPISGLVVVSDTL